MRDLIEGIGYYLSCMILFNGIYGLKIVAKGTVFANSCTKENMTGIATLALAALLVVIGVFFTAQILTTDDSETNSIATGKQFKVTAFVFGVHPFLDLVNQLAVFIQLLFLR